MDYSSTAVAGLTSLKYHWFANNLGGVSRLNFRKTVSWLDYLGYYSVLFPYHIHMSDNFILAANDLDPHESIKYNIAIRTSEISVDQCARMSKAFHEISPGRLILNIIWGSKEDEGIQYVKQLIKNPLFKKTDTQILIANTSTAALELASSVAYSALSDLESFERETPGTDLGDAKIAEFGASSRVMLSLDMVILKEGEGFPHIDTSTIHGTEGIVSERLSTLADRGVTDLIVANNPADPFPERVHDFLQAYMSR